jgi:hypothetical protein
MRPIGGIAFHFRPYGLRRCKKACEVLLCQTAQRRAIGSVHAAARVHVTEHVLTAQQCCLALDFFKSTVSCVADIASSSV